MPTYDYNCWECGAKVMLIVPIAERDEQTCDTCRVPLFRKITFNGLVWHPTSSGHK